MGMFDNIHCKPALPVVWPTQHFQTKSLGCEMNSYIITEDGLLLKPGRDYGTYRIPDMAVPIDGAFEFYDARADSGWLSLRAHFVRGRLDRIEFADWQPYPGKPDQRPPARIASDTEDTP